MQTLDSAHPRTELRPYVRAYAQRRMGVADLLVVEPVPTQLEQVLEFEFGNLSEIWNANGQHHVCDRIAIAGAQTRFAAHMHLSPGTESFGIFFTPTGVSQLFGIPMYVLKDRLEDAVCVLGHRIRLLWNRLGECNSFRERVEIADQFLLQYAARALTKDWTSSLADYVFRMRGAVRVPELAERSGKGMRQIERNFFCHVGISPKSFARIARFQGALDAKVARPDRTWLDIAHTFGYHDQMHMIHDFESLGGDAPGRLLAKLGDIRPPALASAR